MIEIERAIEKKEYIERGALIAYYTPPSRIKQQFFGYFVKNPLTRYLQ